MSMMNRILLTIYTLIIIVISVAILGLFGAMTVGVVTLQSIGIFLSSIAFNWQFFLTATLIAILFLIVSIRLLFSGAKPKAPMNTLIKHTDMGMIIISVNALDSMVEKAVRSFTEVKDVKINISPEADGIKIQLKILIMPDIVLPDLTINLQQKVKEYIEDYSGVIVKEVFIYIDNLSAPQQRSRVQ